MSAPIGLIRDMPFDEYLAIDAVNTSLLKHMNRSPWHCKNRVEIVPTRPMLRGTLAHCAVLEPDAMATRYAIVPEDAPKRPTKAQWNAAKPSESSVAAMDWWTKFNASCEGREIITAEDYAVTQMQLAALKANPVIAGLLSEGYSECTVIWTDPITGLLCKARPDHVHPINKSQVAILDLKSTMDESPSAFSRNAARMQYHLQQAHYVDGFQTATNLEVVDFIFAAVTSKPPVLAVPYILIDEVAAQAEDERRELIELYARCRRDNDWPAYGEGVQMLDFPAYMKRSQEIEVSYVD